MSKKLDTIHRFYRTGIVVQWGAKPHQLGFYPLRWLGKRMLTRAVKQAQARSAQMEVR